MAERENLGEQRQMKLKEHEDRKLALQASVEKRIMVCKFCPSELEKDNYDLVCNKYVQTIL